MIIADLHIHSKYSRATSRDCVPEALDFWARRKGIGLLGTGDFTHPAWRQELREKLVPAEAGLYTLREELRRPDPAAVGAQPPRFVLSGEISSIYKKNGRVRKVHNVILLPGLEEAEALSQRLEAIGNIHSDGRPILGLDSRDLLEITLETCPEAVFIPAHIWTPHFSLFGAFSGFDTIEECFEDLTPHIHALETGLSSDPPMNWRLSALDRYALVSNSDAHSPSKLGREANLLDLSELSYAALADALRGEGGLRGTIEFFPEEGKYHYDGHRSCKLCLTPAETERAGGRCPVCGKKITIGVQHRVEQLADRDEGFTPPGALPFESLAPLCEVIAASVGISAAGTKAAAQYEQMLRELGPEFSILREIPPEEIERVAGPCVAEGIRRLRAGRVQRTPGYDGEYGTISLLEPAEREALGGQISLFGGTPGEKRAAKSAKAARAPRKARADTVQEPEPTAPADPLAQLNERQREAVAAQERAVAVVAGPGTGKTKTLVARIADMIEAHGIKPTEITAVTFTNKAASEMLERLQQRLGGKRAVRSLTVGTFHSICLRLLTERRGEISLIDEYEALEIAQEVLEGLHTKISPKALLQEASRRKNGLTAGESPEGMDEACERYGGRLRELGVLDFDDLLLETLAELENDAEQGEAWTRRFSHLLVDEFQDINPIQYRLVRMWNRAGKSLFVIGDPDQSIYGFRGSDAHCFERLKEDWPELRRISLLQNYRSTPEILRCALPVISHNDGPERMLLPQRPSGATVRLLTAESDLSEAIFVAKEINRMTGGIDMLDAQSLSGSSAQPRSFSDIAVLYRTHRQAQLLEKCLRKEGVPYLVAGREDYLADRSVRGTIGFFRFLLNPQDTASLRTWLRALEGCSEQEAGCIAAQWAASGPDGLSAPLLERIERYRPCAAKEKPAALLKKWGEENGLSTAEPFARLTNMAAFHSDLSSFLQTLLLGQERDLVRSGGKSYASGAVMLMTLHGSKGLEFPAVFLCGLRRGCLPLESPGRPADIAEERRLFYVGMTRAQEELVLLTSQEPSGFLKELPEGAVETGAIGPKRPEGVQLSLFD